MNPVSIRLAVTTLKFVQTSVTTGCATMGDRGDKSPSFQNGETPPSSCSLPLDTLIHIFVRTTPRDVGRLALVSRGFRVAANSDAVWERWTDVIPGTSDRKTLETRHSAKQLHSQFLEEIRAGNGPQGYSFDSITCEIFQTDRPRTLEKVQPLQDASYLQIVKQHLHKCSGPLEALLEAFLKSREAFFSQYSELPLIPF